MNQDKISAVIAWLEEKEKSPRHTSALIREGNGFDEFIDMPLNSKPGLFPLPKNEVCRHPQHNVPMLLYIPPGCGYRHVCPGCGNVITVIPQQISF